MIHLVRYLLCLVSMLLTGLFALNFSAISASQIQLLMPTEKAFFAPIFMLVIGMGIDLSKYLFWRYRYQGMGFLIISVLLVFFSWAASVAFFLSQEQSNLIATQKETLAYQAYQQRTQQLQYTITEKRQLLHKRLDSRYHTQWDKAGELMESINALEQQLIALSSASESIGLTEAQQQLSTAAFFVSLAQLFNVAVNTVTIAAYGILALLIELCALGAISLSQSVKPQYHLSNQPVSCAERETKKPLQSMYPKTYRAPNKPSQSQKKSKDAKNKARLHRDILNGIIPPILRQIRQADYGLSEVNVRAVLQALKAQGVLAQNGQTLRLVQTVKSES